jgi:hypothetical protein
MVEISSSQGEEMRMFRSSKNSWILKALSLGLALGLTVACGGDSGDDDNNDNSTHTGGGGGGGGDISASTQVSTLSAADAGRLCDSLNAQFLSVVSEEELESLSCAFEGFVAAVLSGEEDFQGTCQEAYEECLAAGPDPDDGEEECPLLNDDFRATCQATAGELQACIQDQAQATKELVAEATCENFEAMFADEGGEDEGLSPACQVVDTKCPGFVASIQE